MATYEEYYDMFLKELVKQQVEYEAQREQTAQADIAQVQDTYARLDEAAVTQYTQSAEDTAAAYRAIYDSNAVDELIARRDAEEAIRRMNLQSSGLSNTEQTAISLQRGRADTETTRQKQAAVDAIMRELDALRAEYAATSAQKQAAILSEANEDIAAYGLSVREEASDRAYELYKQDRKTETKQDDQSDATPVEQGGSYLADKNYTSPAGAKVDAMKYKQTKTDAWAVNYLENQQARGVITEEQRLQILKEIGLDSFVFPTRDEVEKEVERLLQEKGEEAALAYLQELYDGKWIDTRMLETIKTIFEIGDWTPMDID